MDKTTHENFHLMWIYQFVVHINNTPIADKIAKQVRDATKTLQEAFEKALTMRAGLQLMMGSYRSPQKPMIPVTFKCMIEASIGYR